MSKKSRSLKKGMKKGLNKVEPILEKGVSAVYSTMSSGLNLGVKSVKSVTKKIASNKRSRMVSFAGGRRRKYKKGTR